MPGQIKISKWQFGLITTGFLIGNSALLTLGTVAGQDVWVSQLIAGGAGILAAGLWFALGNSFNQKLPAEYFKMIAGPIVGSALALLYVGFCILLAALVIKNVTDAYLSTVFVETPITVFAVTMAGLTVISVELGIESYARCAEIITPIVLFFVFLVTVFTFLTPNLARMDSLLPMFERGLVPILKGGLPSFAFPFGESIVMLSILPFVDSQKNAFPYMAIPIALASVGLSVVAVRNVAVLGFEGMREALFPSLLCIQLINIGSFIQRLDAAILFIWTFGSFLKTTACMFAAIKNLKVILKIKSNTILAFPLGSFAAAMSMILFENTVELVDFKEFVWPVLVLPIQILLPAVLLIFWTLKRKWDSL